MVLLVTIIAALVGLVVVAAFLGICFLMLMVRLSEEGFRTPPPAAAEPAGHGEA